MHEQHRCLCNRLSALCYQMVGNILESILCHDVYFYRGERVRTEFASLGEVRSLIPSHVHVMALTATATKCPVARVSAIVGLEDPKLITISPDKPNMCYCV